MTNDTFVSLCVISACPLDICFVVTAKTRGKCMTVLLVISVSPLFAASASIHRAIAALALQVSTFCAARFVIASGINGCGDSQRALA